MPHAQVKLMPGIDVNETPALNQAGISTSQLIRFIPDRNGIGLVQKLGGWTKFYATAISSPVRAILAWDDTNSVIHLAYGSTNALTVITNGTAQVITPTSASDNITPSFNTVAGSSTVAVLDNTITGITSACSVYIQTHISVGGIILFGLYQCSQQSNTYYAITSVDVFGNPLPATTTVIGGGAVASFATVSGSATVTVTLPNHGFAIGATYPALISTTVGGLTIFGNYVIQAVPDVNTFLIKANTNATSSATASINSGNVALLYSYAVGPVLPGTGYGIGGYGQGGYGFGSTITPSTGSAITATDWTLDNYGQQLVAVPINGTSFQPIYVWDPTSGAPYASVIPQAPTLNDGVFVAMPQRQLVTWGSTFTGVQDPLLVRWSDIGNYNVWVGTPTNQAGSYRIPRGSKIVSAMQAPHQGLIWTDLDLWAMQYINLPNVYGFQQLGSGCGLIARKAAGVVQGTVLWMSQSQFFSLGADGISPVFCPVWDVVFQALDLNNLQKIRTAVNSRFNEIAWYYPTTATFTATITGTTLNITAGSIIGVIGPGATLTGTGVTSGTTIVSGSGNTWAVSISQTVSTVTAMQTGGEVTSYVKYNVGMQQWDFGILTRTAWIDQSVLGPPIGAGPNPSTGLTYLYQHETSTDADGSAMLSSFTTGYFAIGDGDNKTFLDQVWPDFKWGYYGGAQTANVQITFNATDYPGDTPVAYGPYTVTVATEYFTTRLRARLISITISSSDTGSFWRLAGMRYRYAPDGKY